MTREISIQDARLPNGFLRDSEILFSMGKESNEAGQVYYHDVRQAAGKNRMKPETKTDLDYDLTKHHLSVRSITLMDGPQVSLWLATLPLGRGSPLLFEAENDSSKTEKIESYVLTIGCDIE